MVGARPSSSDTLGSQPSLVLAIAISGQRCLGSSPGKGSNTSRERLFVMRSTVSALRQHDPGHPMADANGDVWSAPVDENAEMVEMLDSSRQYQNLIEALSTAKQLMLDTMRLK